MFSGVGGEAEPDTDLSQQASDKAQVLLAVLHQLLATRIRLCRVKVLSAHSVAGMQDILNAAHNYQPISAQAFLLLYQLPICQ